MESYSVKLRLYRGKKLYDQNGDVISDGTMDLFPYNSLEWNNFMAYAPKAGYWNAVVVSVEEVSVTTDKNKAGDNVTITKPTKVNMDSDIVTEITAAVKKAFDTTPEVVLTPEQEKSAAMQAEIDELKSILATGGNTVSDVDVNETTSDTGSDGGDSGSGESDDEKLEDARDRYFKAFGKKPNHLMGIPKLEAKIKEKLAE